MCKQCSGSGLIMGFSTYYRCECHLGKELKGTKNKFTINEALLLVPNDALKSIMRQTKETKHQQTNRTPGYGYITSGEGSCGYNLDNDDDWGTCLDCLLDLCECVCDMEAICTTCYQIECECV